MTTTLATWQGVLLKVGEVTIPKEAKLAYENTYPLGSTYRGKAEQCTAKVTVPLPDQLFPAVWEVSLIAATFQNQVKNQGGDMLAIKIYEDTTPTLTTDYYVVATVAQPAPVPAVAFPFPWVVVIPLILILLIIVAFTWLILQVKTIDWGQPAAAIGMAVGIAAILGAGALLLIAWSGKKGKAQEKARG